MAAVAASVLAILGLCPLPASAQSTMPGPPVAPSLPADTGERLPSPKQAIAAFSLLEGWVRDWRVPPAPDPAQRIASDPEIPSAPGVCVTLRLEGRVIGRGIDLSGWANDGADDRRRLWRAAADAIRQADARLPLDNDALRNDRRAELTKRIVISLELAGVPTPVQGDSWPEVEAEMRPGLDGVAVRLTDAEAGGGGQAWEAIFPADALARNTPPSRALSALVSAALGDGGAATALLPPKVWREQHGVRAARFRTVHLMQTGAGGGPEFLHRGARVIGRDQLTEAELRNMADGLARHLTVSEPAWVRHGARVQHADELSQHALAAFALARYAGTPGVAPASAAAARSAAATRVQAALGHAKGAESRTTVLPATAVAALDELGRTSAPPPIDSASSRSALALDRDAAARDFRQSFPRVFAPASGFDSGLPAPARGVVALGAALSIDEREPGATLSRSDAVAAVRRVFADTGDDALVAQMPWLGWAELRLCESGDVPAAVALRRMRSRVWTFQLTPSDAGADDPDMAGGIVFTRGSTPLPTWQSVRPLAFIATMLGDPRLTERAERGREIVRLSASLRFLRQLQVDESSAWMYPDRNAALGGIRASVWDTSLPVDATSLTLLAVCETLRSFEAIRAEPASDTGEAK